MHADHRSGEEWLRNVEPILGCPVFNRVLPVLATVTLIAVGLAIIGAVLAWAALARSSTPEPALAPAPNDQRMPSTSSSAPRRYAGADARRGQPLITSTKGLDVKPELGSSTRSR
jgi:hypothetical protein